MKMTLIIITSIFAILIIGGVLFINTAEVFGGDSDKIESPNYKDGKFVNLVPTNMMSDSSSFLKNLYDFIFSRDSESKFKGTITTREVDIEKFSKVSEDDIAISWLGHSTTLIGTGEYTIITDPILHSKSLDPLSFGPKGFKFSNSYSIEKLPKIDIVLISHDHYDHLDMSSIKQLRNCRFYVPLGVKAHLLRWGVKNENVIEFDWYDSIKVSDNLELIFTPSRHFSGRKIFDANSTLWGGWIVKANGKKNLF